MTEISLPAGHKDAVACFKKALNRLAFFPF
jgi:hypothetical protein